MARSRRLARSVTSIPEWVSSASLRLFRTQRISPISQGRSQITRRTSFARSFDELEKLSGKKYSEHDCRIAGSAQRTQRHSRKIDVAFRVIADHIRALSHSQLPTESFRQTKGAATFCAGFLRRAVRYGRTLGFHEPFLTIMLVVVAVYDAATCFPRLSGKTAANRKNNSPRRRSV